MNKKNWYLGAAALGVLLTMSLVGDAWARKVGWLYGNGLHIEAEPRDAAPNVATGSEDAYIAGDVEVAGGIFAVVPATQTISASGTITADACGGLKRVTCSGDITTSTSLTFTAPAAANKGCKMRVENVANLSGTACTLYLDGNALFPLTQGFASMALAPGGSIEVFSTGAEWLSSSWTEF